MRERINQFKQLWKSMLPAVPVPPDAQVFRWAGKFTDAEMEYALARLSNKAQRTTFEGDGAYRYLTSILVHEAQAVGAAR